MQKKLLNFSLLSIGFIFTIYSCIRAKDSHSKGLSDLDKKYLIKIERQFRNDSLSKIEYAVKKSDLLLRKREYDKAIKFYEDLDSLDAGYFKYPMEKRILLNDMKILKYSNEGKMKDRDSLINYMINYFKKESFSTKDNNILNFIIDKRRQMDLMLWSYERINLDIDGSIKKN